MTLGLSLLALLALLVAYASRSPPPPVPVSAPSTHFSAERAMLHLREIAQRPHPPGSADHARVRGYVVAQLRALGLEVQVQETTAFSRGEGVAGRVRNVLARLHGSGGSGRAVLLAAHYDGVGAGPAAADDGSGVAVLLETVRALRSGERLRHDLILLFSDGEEAALLGAAAFVGEHPWARDVAVILNFEARGVRGRSVMFESSPGNGDLVRALRGHGDVEASSFWTPIYRALPNDTDLSRLMELDVPALNFAFVDGLERYHTAEDDTAHIDPASLQHHGEQALYLTRRFASGALPEATEVDAVFFRVPLVGLVSYSERWNAFLALLLCGFVGVAGVLVARKESRWGRDLVLGVLGTLAAALAGVVTAAPLLMFAPVGVSAEGWRGAYAAALGLASLAAAMALWFLLRRRAGEAGAQLGAVLVWAAAGLLTIRFAGGASYLFLWPAMAGALSVLAATLRAESRLRLALRAGSVFVTLTLVVPALYLISVVGLGVLGPGGLVIAFFTPLTAWLLAPLLEELIGAGGWRAPAAAAAAAVAIFGVSAVVPRAADAAPVKSVLAYALDADAHQAWLVSPRFLSKPGSWAARALRAADLSGGPTSPRSAHPDWANRSIGYPYPMNSAPVQPVPLAGLILERVAERPVPGGREVVLRLHAPEETLALELLLSGASVRSVVLDGRPLGYRGEGDGRSTWSIRYVAPPPEGVLLQVTLGAGAAALEVIARSAGLPSPVAERIPARPPAVLPGLTGDVTVVRRLFTL